MLKVEGEGRPLGLWDCVIKGAEGPQPYLLPLPFDSSHGPATFAWPPAPHHRTHPSLAGTSACFPARGCPSPKFSLHCAVEPSTVPMCHRDVRSPSFHSAYLTQSGTY